MRASDFIKEAKLIQENSEAEMSLLEALQGLQKTYARNFALATACVISTGGDFEKALQRAEEEQKRMTR
jgi:hypothetical protein